MTDEELIAALEAKGYLVLGPALTRQCRACGADWATEQSKAETWLHLPECPWHVPIICTCPKDV